MDSLITAAARLLAAGDPLGALNRIALRKDAPALALRGIAMAQLGDFAKARTLVRAAARAFGTREAVSRARCAIAEAEIAFASRDLGWPARELEAAARTLNTHGDHLNAAHARYLEIRRRLLIGKLDDAGKRLGALDVRKLPPALRAGHELLIAGIAIRRLQTRPARSALIRAERAARESGIRALLAEVENAQRMLATPAARLTSGEQIKVLVLEEVEALFRSKTLVVDACRFAVRARDSVVSLAGRPVLFNLLRALAEAWPGDVPRELLVARTFRTRHMDETHRARLRVEIGRLRKLLRNLAAVKATPLGFALQPLHAREVAVLAQPVEGEHFEILALLADGEFWSSSALALALDTSQRKVQRGLDELAAARKVQPFGQGRARRWTTPPLPGITTTLLLPAPLPGD